jgi:hypothetical protein
MPGMPGRAKFAPVADYAQLFANVRLVAAGDRVFKTSASTTESGVIKGFYSDRGSKINKNFA